MLLPFAPQNASVPPQVAQESLAFHPASSSNDNEFLIRFRRHGTPGIPAAFENLR